mmetsp:Transcript_19711/g.31622  ORF Transcript_19711/g.31622 Transcript_19711/m.31622 type:complete len:202 (-) Transcript_19711:206-811(-)|eukprot:CAMPEP_0171493728 /NCGR_PEP_ID=MMETSP0958-20121227/5123_1 /TAXON_ID=87120 /ORGANISM="Aurantiochytrium limacinum, Strain ATCCMYA-1381" /LENGTH=201 /DNA_ID=CAMNT_0012027383 /DNA_START=139 /DNA_END=744 /DNA_ORIENTATION=+
MDNLERLLAELLTDFDTISTTRKQYRDMLDDVIRTTTARYVTEATSGFFPDKTQPAYIYLRAALRLARASQEGPGEERVSLVQGALDDAQQARWEGVDQNTHEVHGDVPHLRADADARSADEYNHKLAEIYDQAGDLFNQVRGRGHPESENMFTAIAQIAMICSFPDEIPYKFTKDERNGAVRKCEDMIKFSLRICRSKTH